MLENEIAKVLAVVALAGFAIQQFLQMQDPVVMAAIAAYKQRRATKDLPGGISDADFKKAFMAFLGFSAGMVTVAITDIRVLRLLDPSWFAIGDQIVTGLVVSGGTEAFNTLLKYFGYVKDARKQALDVVITITPPTATVAKNTPFQFLARVENGPQVVTWSVLHGGGGLIDAKTGLYTAPNTAGTYQIAATSSIDPTRPTLATVTVPT